MGSHQATHGFVQPRLENQDGDQTTSLGNMLNCLAVLVGKKLFLTASPKASLPLLYICCLLFSCQAALDTLRYWVLLGALNVVSSPG